MFPCTCCEFLSNMMEAKVGPQKAHRIHFRSIKRALWQKNNETRYRIYLEWHAQQNIHRVGVISFKVYLAHRK